MKANRVARFGPPDVIEFVETAIPMPAAGEVLVRVSAAGVGPWDALVRAGKSGLPQPLPLTLGAELAGSVEAIGAGVGAFAPGDEIFGSTNANFTGAYGEYAVASADRLARKPAGLTWLESAAVPVVAVTALQMLDRAQLASGGRILIHGASGSVGSMLVQLARERGLDIVGTIASDDGDYLRRLGAGTVVDVRSRRFDDVVEPVDAVFDLVGGAAQARSFAVLKPGGLLASVVSPPDDVEAKRHDVRTDFFFVNVNTAELTAVGTMLDDGRLRVRVGTVLSLAEAREAHEMLEGRRPHDAGKIVLRVAGSWKR